MRRIFRLVLLASLLCSCGKNTEAPEAPEAPEAKIMQSQREQLQKVKELEDSVQKAENAHREEIEKQINGETSNK